MLRFQQDIVATALVAIVEPDLETMHYASAGHPPPIVAGPASPARSLPYGSAPLGVEVSLEVESFVVPLERDAVVVFYTDGITEFRRQIDETERALRDAASRLARHPGIQRPALTMRREVMGSERPADDAVLLILQRRPADAGASAIDERSVRKRWSFHSSDAYSARRTRHELVQFMRRFVAGDDELSAAELIVGEILANTVEHAPGLVKVEVDWAAAHPIVTVLDAGPGMSSLARRLPEDNLTEHGRGLFLISTLAENVRFEPAPGHGTKIVVTLPVTRST